MQQTVKVVDINDFHPCDIFPPDFYLSILFAGDRKSCCEKAVLLEVNGQIVAATTISFTGEAGTNEPTIVGVYVHPEHRRKGYATQVLIETLKECKQYNLGVMRIDSISQGMHEVIQKLPEEWRVLQEYQSFGTW